MRMKLSLLIICAVLAHGSSNTSNVSPKGKKRQTIDRINRFRYLNDIDKNNNNNDTLPNYKNKQNKYTLPDDINNDKKNTLPNVKNNNKKYTLPDDKTNNENDIMPDDKNNNKQTIQTRAPTYSPSMSFRTYFKPSWKPTSVPSLMPSESPLSAPFSVPTLPLKSSPFDMSSVLPTQFQSQIPTEYSSSLPSQTPSSLPDDKHKQNKDILPNVKKNNKKDTLPAEKQNNKKDIFPNDKNNQKKESLANIRNNKESALPDENKKNKKDNLPDDKKNNKKDTLPNDKNNKQTIETMTPSYSPSISIQPTSLPSNRPSKLPTQFPSQIPTEYPSSLPTVNTVGGTKDVFDDNNEQGRQSGCHPPIGAVTSFAEESAVRITATFQYILTATEGSDLNEILTIIEDYIHNEIFLNYINCPGANDARVLSTRMEAFPDWPIGVSSLPRDKQDSAKTCSSPTPSEVCEVIDGSVTLLYEKDSSITKSEAQEYLLNFMAISANNGEFENIDIRVSRLAFLDMGQDTNTEKLDIVIASINDNDYSVPRRRIDPLLVSIISISCAGIVIGVIVVRKSRRKEKVPVQNFDNSKKMTFPSKSEIMSDVMEI